MPLPQDLISGTNCFTCLGVSLEDALGLALWQRISQSITPPGGDTFYRISAVGDVRVSSATDNRIYQ